MDIVGRSRRMLRLLSIPDPIANSENTAVLTNSVTVRSTRGLLLAKWPYESYLDGAIKRSRADIFTEYIPKGVR